jgi:hypothetical protein
VLEESSGATSLIGGAFIGQASLSSSITILDDRISAVETNQIDMKEQMSSIMQTQEDHFKMLMEAISNLQGPRTSHSTQVTTPTHGAMTEPEANPEKAEKSVPIGIHNNIGTPRMSS